MKNKKKLKKAIALKYDIGKDRAPTIVASGLGIVAENIIEKAGKSEIAIYEDERLVKELLQFKVGTEIPEELYEIVAQVLIFIEDIDKKKGTGKYSKYY